MLLFVIYRTLRNVAGYKLRGVKSRILDVRGTGVGRQHVLHAVGGRK